MPLYLESFFVALNIQQLRNVKYDRTDQTKKYPTRRKGWINSKYIEKIN